MHTAEHDHHHHVHNDLDPSNPGSGQIGTDPDTGKPIWSATRTAAHIVRPGNSWANGNDDLPVT